MKLPNPVHTYDWSYLLNRFAGYGLQPCHVIKCPYYSFKHRNICTNCLSMVANDCTLKLAVNLKRLINETTYS